MRLVAEQPGIFTTIQGSGVWAGMPMCFVRTFGCDYNCSWCDTQYARKGKYIELGVEEIAKKVVETNCDHMVITGGNPLLQSKEVEELLRCLSGKHIRTMLATQGSFSTENIYSILFHISVLALSPKLHDWRWDPLEAILHAATNYRKTIQVDIVCQSVEDIDDALAHMMRIEKAHTFGNHKELIHFCLVPEYSVGEGFIHIMKKQVLSWAALGCKPIPRIMPQLHKLVYLVP